MKEPRHSIRLTFPIGLAVGRAMIAYRKRTGEEINITSAHLMGLRLLCEQEGVPWPETDTQEPS